jgi:predicted outer membrane repeat protein
LLPVYAETASQNQDCIIDSNSAVGSNGGGFYAEDAVSFDIFHTVVSNNVAKYFGGAAFVKDNTGGAGGTVLVSSLQHMSVCII